MLGEAGELVQAFVVAEEPARATRYASDLVVVVVRGVVAVAAVIAPVTVEARPGVVVAMSTLLLRLGQWSVGEG